MVGKVVLNHRNTTFFSLFPMTRVSKSLHIFTRIIRRRKNTVRSTLSSKTERRMLRAEQSVGSLRESVCCTLNANVTLNAVYFFSIAYSRLRYALRAHMTSRLVNYSQHPSLTTTAIWTLIHTSSYRIVSFHFFQLTCSSCNDASVSLED